MAKLNSSTVTITVSCLERDSEREITPLVSEDLVAQLEAIVTELVDKPGVLVEVHTRSED